MGFSLSPDRESRCSDILTRYPHKRAACLPLLHLCQEQAGWCSPEVISFVATRLDMDPSAVTGIVTFYTMFHQTPVAPTVIWVCRTLSCELRGAKQIQDHLESRLGCKVGETSPDGKYTLKKAECLAACGYGPMIQMNDRYIENLTPEKLDTLFPSSRIAEQSMGGGQSHAVRRVEADRDAASGTAPETTPAATTPNNP